LNYLRAAIAFSAADLGLNVVMLDPVGLAGDASSAIESGHTHSRANSPDEISVSTFAS
jgi:hypothetical protein